MMTSIFAHRRPALRKSGLSRDQRSTGKRNPSSIGLPPTGTCQSLNSGFGTSKFSNESPDEKVAPYVSLPSIFGALKDSDGTAFEAADTMAGCSAPLPVQEHQLHRGSPPSACVASKPSNTSVAVTGAYHSFGTRMPQLHSLPSTNVWHKDQVLVGLQQSRGGPSMSTAEMLMCVADPTFAPYMSSSSSEVKQVTALFSTGGPHQQHVPSQLLRASPLSKVSEACCSEQGFRSTSQLWRSYLNAKSMSTPHLSRSPLWANANNEEQIEGRIRELDDLDDWRRQRDVLQRHIREVPESNMKRKLVGDPRLHDGNSLHHIQRLKTEDIQRHRDRSRKIKYVMGECSKSRYQLMRMQKVLVPLEGLPSRPLAAEDVALSGNVEATSPEITTCGSAQP